MPLAINLLLSPSNSHVHWYSKHLIPTDFTAAPWCWVNRRVNNSTTRQPWDPWVPWVPAAPRVSRAPWAATPAAQITPDPIKQFQFQTNPLYRCVVGHPPAHSMPLCNLEFRIGPCHFHFTYFREYICLRLGLRRFHR